MNHPVPEIITPLGIYSIAEFMINKDEEDSQPLVWRVRIRMISTSSKEKEKVFEDE